MPQRYILCILACLTLGLAPFVPEPHLVEKLRWLVQGTQKLKPIDWFDLALHSAPWIVLIGLIIRDIFFKG